MSYKKKKETDIKMQLVKERLEHSKHREGTEVATLYIGVEPELNQDLGSHTTYTTCSAE